VLWDVTQELYLDHNQNSHATLHWYMVYLKEHYIEPGKTRAIILVNKKIAANSWTQVDFRLSTITAIQVKMESGKVLIINTYNDSTHSNAISQTLKIMWARVQLGGDETGNLHTLWLGDFNRHHLMWDESHNVHLFTRTNLDKASCLLML